MFIKIIRHITKHLYQCKNDTYISYGITLDTTLNTMGKLDQGHISSTSKGLRWIFVVAPLNTSHILFLQYLHAHCIIQDLPPELPRLGEFPLWASASSSHESAAFGSSWGSGAYITDPVVPSVISFLDRGAICFPPKKEGLRLQ